MSNTFFEEIQNMFAVMAGTVLQVISYYFFIPMAIVIVILMVLGYVFRVRGKILVFVFGIAAIICFIAFVYDGLPNLTDLYYEKIDMK